MTSLRRDAPLPTAFRSVFPPAQWSIAGCAMNQMLPMGKVLGIFSLMRLLSYCGLYKKTLRTDIACQGSQTESCLLLSFSNIRCWSILSYFYLFKMVFQINDCPLAEIKWHLPFDLRRNICIICLLHFQNGPDGATLAWILNPGIWRLF